MHILLVLSLGRGNFRIGIEAIVYPFIPATFGGHFVKKFGGYKARVMPLNVPLDL